MLSWMSDIDSSGHINTLPWFSRHNSQLYSQGLFVTFYEWDKGKTHWKTRDKYYILLHVSLRLDGKHQVETDQINIRGKTLNIYRILHLAGKLFASLYFKAFLLLMCTNILYFILLYMSLYKLFMWTYKNTVSM